MKRTLQHRLNRLFRRRGGLPHSARVPGASFDRQYQQGSFGRPRTGPYEVNLRWRQWLWRAAMATLAVGALWMAWQSWIGLGLFAN
jgi:hypothetical protein